MDAAPYTRLERVARTGSTNADLLAAAAADPAGWPHLSALVADAQDAGRGRGGRRWLTPPGAALTVSVLVRPRVPAARLPWVTLLAGLAVQRATTQLLHGPAAPATAVKWPNDVLVVDVGDADLPGWGRDRKVAGILTEVLPRVPVRTGGPVGGKPGPGASRADGEPAAGENQAVVVGIGLNVAQGPAELPVPWATSLRMAGASATVPMALTAVGEQLAILVARWEAVGGDPAAGGLAVEVDDVCRTLGRSVEVDLPDGTVLAGTATDLDEEGRLLLALPDGRRVAVAAGDVRHLRGG